MKFEAANAAPDSWERRTVGEACARITSGGTPSRRVPSFYEQGTVPWVKTKELNDGVILETEELITELALDSSSAKLLPPGTILLAMYGATVGMLGVLGKPMACNQACCALIPGANTDRDYLYYQLLAHRQQLQGLATGAAQQNLSGAQIKQLVLPFPSLDEQRSIGRTLRILDDRITLLRETNATLEAIAQALFKSWFVDFDPVRAKMAGHPPEGMDAATAALFPDTLEESELGLVPKGWRIGCIEELCSAITNGGTPSRSKPNFWDGGSIPWFKTGDFHDGFLLKPSECITGDALSGSSVKLLPKNAILMAIYAAPTVGRLGILTEPATFNQACTGMVAKAEVGPWFVFWTLFNGRDWFNSRANGAAQQNISKAIVAAYRVVVPSQLVLDAFNGAVSMLHDAIRSNAEKSQTLSELRDTLLPRLISGQLRLPEAPTQQEAAA